MLYYATDYYKYSKIIHITIQAQKNVQRTDLLHEYGILKTSFFLGTL